MIDPHVHLRDWEQNDSETLLHGMLTAVNCGINAVFDMPNTKPPITDEKLVIKRLADGEKSALEVQKITKIKPEYYLYMGLLDQKEQIEEAVRIYKKYSRVIGLKMFASHSTGNLGILSSASQQNVYKTLAENDFQGVLAVHCEETDFFKPNQTAHYKMRPPEAEEESVKRQIEYAEKYNFKGNLHICHISTKKSVDMVQRAKKNIRITCGATPHHLLLNCTDEKGFIKMNPPLRTEENRTALFEDLLEGKIDWIESDHAPHTIKEKENGACGIPGFEGMLILASCLKELNRLDVLEKSNINICRTFGVKIPFSVPQLGRKEYAHNAYCFSAWPEVL